MNATENMHEVRFPNNSILSHIVCYISTLTILVWQKQQWFFQRLDRVSVTHLQCIMVISKIKYEFFYLDFFYFRIKHLLLYD